MSEQTHQKYPPSVQHGIPRLSPAQKGWKSVAIGKLVTEVVRPVEMGDDEIYTLVTAKRSRGGIVKREDLKGREIAVKNQFYIQAGDFIISKRQIVHGACGFVPKELDGAIVSNEYLALNFTDKVIPQFWEFLTHTIYFQQVCFHSSIGVHVEKMLFKVPRWYQWTVNIPTLKEQEKIASFLGTIDIRLTQLRRKHELLQTYKRGVMQKIFSQQIRFKDDDGQPFPDWETTLVKDIATNIFSGRSKASKDFGNYPVYGSTGIIGKSEIGDYSGESILIARVGANAGKISFVSGVYGVTDNTIIVNTTSSYNIHLLRIQLEMKRLNSMVFGSGQPLITGTQIKKLHLVCPKSIEEQRKIVGFLMAIDKKIEAIAKQIELTEQFKKGLLQKMFV